MKVNATVKERVFSIDSITEKEGLILRTLLNHSDDYIPEILNNDKGYWDGIMKEKEALEIGINIRDKIFEMVDEE